MLRFSFILACVLGLAAVTAGSARAEYDSGGAPANASQMQANRPQPPKQIEWVDLGKLVFAQDGIIIRVQPAVFVPSRLKPAPAKKPLPKPPANPRTAVPY